MRQNRKQLEFQDVSDDVRNLNTRELFQNILQKSAEFVSVDINVWLQTFLLNVSNSQAGFRKAAVM